MKFLHYLLVFLLATLPIVELRGAYPFAVYYQLTPSLYIPLILLGNLLPVPFIYYFSTYLLHSMVKHKIAGNFASNILKKGKKLGDKWKAQSNRSIYLLFSLFIMLPLPGSGVWTATLAASILQLPLRKVLIYAFIGILLSSLIVFSVLWSSLFLFFS